jgi:stage IV sporulation protein FB
MLRLGIPVGSALGIRLYLHWSLVVAILVLLWVYGWAWVVGYVLILWSVLLHELGHCSVAGRYGIPASSIMLSPLGGVACLDGRDLSPGEELAITAAGPAVSLLLSVVASALGRWLPAGPRSLAELLCEVNLVLFAFNLIPAFPMDGGRLLRAVLHWRLGDLPTATRCAVWVSRFFCGVLGGCAALRLDPLLMAIAVMIAAMGKLELDGLNTEVAHRINSAAAVTRDDRQAYNRTGQGVDFKGGDR